MSDLTLAERRRLNLRFPEETVRPEEIGQVQILGRVLWRSW